MSQHEAPRHVLSDEQRAMLDFEKRIFKAPGQKATVIYKEFGISPTRYYQRLYRLIHTPQALEAEPILVNRLLKKVEEQTAVAEHFRRKIK